MTPTRRRRIAFHQLGSAPPTTVWPCAQDDRHEGTALIANWLLTALVKIVTTYTQPGQRVLLLTPSTPVRTGPYDGLFEAAWTVMRLGRGVDTQTAQPSPNHGLDRFDLIIAAAERKAFPACHLVDWIDRLAPTGTLAVITHGGFDHGHLVDPDNSIMAAARSIGLRYHDRIALLTIPVRGDVLPSALGPSARHIPAHHDLMAFTRATAASDTDRSGAVGMLMSDG